MIDQRAVIAAFTRQSQIDNSRDEVAQFLDTTVDERLFVLSDLCRLGSELLAQNPRAPLVLDSEDPLSIESQALMAKLRKKRLEAL